MKTLVIGASENPSRYAYKAIVSLGRHGHEVAAIGNRNGQVGDVKFMTEKAPLENMDTVTLYVNPRIQEAYYDYILSLKPRRVIFNPGTENLELMDILKQNGIESVIACTLVMLSTNQF